MIRIRKWLRTAPQQDDWFGVHIRELYQKLTVWYNKFYK